jgi:two-component system NarL family sensor kinase
MTMIRLERPALDTAPAVPSPGAHGHRRVGGSLVTRAVARFVVAGLLAACLIGVGTFLVVSKDAGDQAISHATEITEVEGRGIIEPALTDALLTGDATAIGTLDTLVHQRILTADVVRVKLWNASGTIVYSDEHRLIGQYFGLGGDETSALHTGVADANVSNLGEPENQYERGFGTLLQVYFPVHTPSGTPLLFETYQRYTAITQYQQSVWSSFLPVLIAGLALLFVVQIPLSVGLARRLRSSLTQREALLERAINASEQERRRIARDLHDGVVQKLAGVTYSLNALSRRMRPERPTAAPAADADLATLDATAGEIRTAMRDLRTLIVEIAPPNLVAEGIDNALRDLLEPLAARGVRTRLDAPHDAGLSASMTTLIFRVAQEALRNSANHADPEHVHVRLRRAGDRVSLEVEDDGRGFTDADLERRRRGGHVGLSLLRDLVVDAGGSLRVVSNPDSGTIVTVEVPCS